MPRGIGRSPNLGGIFAASFLTLSFDYWEVRANEILHHHGFLSNLERRATPNLRLDNEINDLFEYMLLQSGRLILQPANERAIILDNVPFIKKKEAQIMKEFLARPARGYSPRE